MSSALPRYSSAQSPRGQSSHSTSEPPAELASRLLPPKDSLSVNLDIAISNGSPTPARAISILPKLKSLPPDPRSSCYDSSLNRYALVPASFPSQDSFSTQSSESYSAISKTLHRPTHRVHSKDLWTQSFPSSDSPLSENSHPDSAAHTHRNLFKKAKTNRSSTGALDKACDRDQGRWKRRKDRQERRARKAHKECGKQRARATVENEYCAEYEDSGYVSASDSSAAAGASTSRFLMSDVRTPSVEPEALCSPRMVEAAQILMSFKTGVPL